MNMDESWGDRLRGYAAGLQRRPAIERRHYIAGSDLDAMTKIVDLQTYRSRLLNERAFGAWRRRFEETYDSSSRLSDLSNSTLLFLARPGDAGTTAFYEIIMGVLNLGDASEFYVLAKSDQLKVVDTHLFLADQIRFELMRRIEWVQWFPCQEFDLVTLILQAEQLKNAHRGVPPKLSPSHPSFETFKALTTPDKESFIRRLLSEALETFRNAIG